VNIYSQKTGEFEFKPGPIMAQVVLADEINRAPSKTQAALLEVMEERQTTVDGVAYQMSEPFFLIATMNPIEYHGIFPLPEAQLDRFMMRISLGYATPDQELAIIERQQTQHPLEEVSPVTTPEQLVFLQNEVKEVYVDPLVRQYIVSISQTSRQHSEIALGISHRGSLAMFRTTQALALARRREFVVPDDVKELAPSVLAHRIILTPEARARGLNGEKVITGILDNLPVPGVS
jgi:MoxR-like ATPase